MTDPTRPVCRTCGGQYRHTVHDFTYLGHGSYRQTDSEYDCPDCTEGVPPCEVCAQPATVRVDGMDACAECARDAEEV
jgi:hypothetical protein